MQVEPVLKSLGKELRSSSLCTSLLLPVRCRARAAVCLVLVLVLVLMVCRTWLVIDIVSCLPLECMLTAGGVAYNYNFGHLNRLLKATAVLRRAHGDPFRIINHIPAIKRNFNYSLRSVERCPLLLLHDLRGIVKHARRTTFWRLLSASLRAVAWCSPC